ncbi:hypothetical protein EJ05DRAFT_492980 [Pseudovirgaria hyperparasitica]|uniref:DUF7704 domain-containing protein n=1 Tax=Pseudovirgaria hyperparasitica TaxID=470096 RepID=A0A6A6W7U2_9PEZI|nr:uncharacterized protein EJ05DRAFT_492980 [Pseudovirgaria hyperparasitica]KAF2757956.1 hypothetical protein EJ05DRAFT_492980 [Pseudovirgaria hyperparasitica]
MATPDSLSAIPLWYRLFFLYIEPISTIVGAVYAQFYPFTYLQLTHARSAPASTDAIPEGTRIVLSQLANLYFAFTLNEALVLRTTSNIRVWKVLLLGLLIADFGHIFTVHSLGVQIYWQFWTWNAIDWGNLGFVYLGALSRSCFILGVGLPTRQKSVKTR